MKNVLVSSKLLGALVIGGTIGVTTANASLSIVNGDFENNAPASNVADVDSWFNWVSSTPANWWLGTWYGPTVSPNGTSVMGLSWDGNQGHWGYQAIGVNDGGLATLDLQFDVGSFTDAGGNRDLGVTWSVYQSDGSFVGANDVDVEGGVGITLIDSFSQASGALAPGASVTLTASLDLSTANTTDQLYLRVINYEGGTGGQPWAAIDNVLIVVPEPTTLALGGLGIASLLIFRRRRNA